METRSDRKLRGIWDVCFIIVAVVGFALLIYSAMHGDRYRLDLREVKVVSYICIQLLLARIFFRLLAGCKNSWKYFGVILLNLVVTCGIFIFNNLLHYHGFSSMFGYPEDIKLYHFIVSDIVYSGGLGPFRYILFFLLGVMSFTLIDQGLPQPIRRGLAYIGDLLIWGVDAAFAKMGFFELFGLTYDEDTADTDSQQRKE